MNASERNDLPMFTPIHNLVLIETIERDNVQASSGIILDSETKEEPQEALVIKVGPGIRKPDGTYLEMSVAEGDRVIFSRYAGTKIKRQEKNYIVIRETDILAIIQ